MVWFDKIKYIELDLGDCLELGRKNWDTAHGEEGESVVSLALSTRYIGERSVTKLDGAVERDNLLADVSSTKYFLVFC